MNANTRRQLAALLCGTAAALVALAVATYLRERACVEAGGRWLATRQCELAAAGTPGGAPGGARAYALGALAGLLTLVVLWRTFTFFAMRASRRAP